MTKTIAITFKATHNQTSFPYTLTKVVEHLGDLRVGGKYSKENVQKFVDNPKFKVTIVA